MGRLTETDAKQLWPTDASLAAWLASNLDAIGDATGLKLKRGEQLVADTPVVMAEDGGSAVVVVCQSGTSSDEAFGCLVRHVAASQAATAIWICGAPGDEHVAAVSWLNRSVEGRFTMLRVRGVTIGQSAAAPVFEVAVRSPRSDDPGVEVADSARAAGNSASRRADDWLEDAIGD